MNSSSSKWNKYIVIYLLLLSIFQTTTTTNGFRLKTNNNNHRIINYQNENKYNTIERSKIPATTTTTSNTMLHMDATIVPILLGATGAIFAGKLKHEKWLE